MPQAARVAAVCLVASIVTVVACGSEGGGPIGPSAMLSLPFVQETASTRYYYEAGDTVEVERQEVFNAWALEQLGVQPPQRIEYRKYLSRDAMGRYTGNFSTNGFAEPGLWRLHTIWLFDNHEVVHLFTSIVGRPSDFFNEGIAVSMQVDPARGNFVPSFNGLDVHDACRGYLRSNLLPLPVSRYVTTSEFRGIPDQVLSYRYAGSFVRFLTERYGRPAVLQYFRSGTREESLSTIRSRMLETFGASLDAIEADWLAFLRR